MGAALLAMVCRVTLQREPAAPALLGEAAGAADRLRDTAVGLSAADSAAYADVLHARRRARDGEASALGEAMKRATDVPLATARAGRDVLAGCAGVVAHVRASTLSDLGVGTTLAWAGLEAGALTARTNLADVSDEEYTATSWRALARLIDEGATLREHVNETMAGRRRTA
jgi:methenyltetrahydrofolate cyclohydrolase